jgi:hypothetical protein
MGAGPLFRLRCPHRLTRRRPVLTRLCADTPNGYLANAMVDQHIGLEETDDGIGAIHFNTILLATFDERDCIIRG